MIEFVLFTILLILSYFVVTHLRSLNYEEVSQLGTKRRTKEIKKYYSFIRTEFEANKEFKSNMNRGGRFYNCNVPLSEFPAQAAALLKYKKHEWVIFAYEKDKKIFLFWCNKGENKSRVVSTITDQEILKVVEGKKITSILHFHNHPNSNPSKYRVYNSSEVDVHSANYLSALLTDNHMNLLEFVCERGVSYEFHRAISESFLPLTDFIFEINSFNGKSGMSNFNLHMERIF